MSINKYVALNRITEQKLRYLADRLRFQVPWDSYIPIRRIVDQWLRGHRAALYEIYEVIHILEDSDAMRWRCKKKYRPVRRKTYTITYPVYTLRPPLLILHGCQGFYTAIHGLMQQVYKTRTITKSQKR